MLVTSLFLLIQVLRPQNLFSDFGMFFGISENATERSTMIDSINNNNNNSSKDLAHNNDSSKIFDVDPNMDFVGPNNDRNSDRSSSYRDIDYYFFRDRYSPAVNKSNNNSDIDSGDGFLEQSPFKIEDGKILFDCVNNKSLPLTAKKLLPSRKEEDPAKKLSEARIFDNDPLNYTVCQFRNVCIKPYHWTIFVASEEEREEMTEKYQNVSTIMTWCFHRLIKVEFVYLPNASNPNHFIGGAWWTSNKWVNGRHIGHWMEEMGVIHSVFLHGSSYQLPQFKGLVLESDFHMSRWTDHEKFIYNFTFSNLNYKFSDIYFNENLTSTVCFDNVYTSGIVGQIARSPLDAKCFRQSAFKLIDESLTTFCPPKNVVFLYRIEPANRPRLLMNEEQILQLLRDRKIPFNKTTITSLSKSKEQSSLFRNTGFMLSAHSSQLVNMVFSPPNASVIEITPVLLNFDFAEIGLQMGVFYQFALGGFAPRNSSEPQDWKVKLPNEAIESCNQELIGCNGEVHCMHNVVESDNFFQRCMNSSLPLGSYFDYRMEVKQRNFFANVTAVAIAIDKAIEHMDRACGGPGTWLGQNAENKKR